MILEEAIKHCEEAAQKCEDFVRRHSCDRELGFVKRCQKCAEEQRQLAEWLRELKELRIENKALKNRCADFEHGAPCRYCPLDCEFRKHEFEGRDDDW
jgi:hypothetical protein